MSHHRAYTLLPSSSVSESRSRNFQHESLDGSPDRGSQDGKSLCPDEESSTHDMGGSSRDDEESAGYAVGDLEGKTVVQVKTELINRALDETGMGKYQWCMCVSFPSFSAPFVFLCHLLFRAYYSSRPELLSAFHVFITLSKDLLCHAGTGTHRDLYCRFFLCGFGYALDLMWAQAFSLVTPRIQQELGIADKDYGDIFSGEWVDSKRWFAVHIAAVRVPGCTSSQYHDRLRSCPSDMAWPYAVCGRFCTCKPS
jgi:hypothetical protein